MTKDIRIASIAALPVLVFLAAGALDVRTDGIQHTVGQEWTAGSLIEVLLSARPVEEIWREECASCHGPDGKGETRAGRRAGVKDFTDVEYQSSWTDDEAVQVIKTATKDGKELRNKNPFAEELTEEEIRSLVAHVRKFAPGWAGHASR